MITKKQSEGKYTYLSNSERYAVINILFQIRNNYIHNNFQIDVPYYVWSFYTQLFYTEEEGREYTSIDDSDEFVIYTIYYLARFIIDNRKK